MGASASYPSVRVVVVGGGYAGVELLQSLKGKVSLTLIEPQDRFFHNVGAPRAAVEDRFEERLFLPYTHLLAEKRAGSACGPVRHVRGSASSIDTVAKIVSVAPADGSAGARIAVEYDILILATGRSNGAPAKPTSFDAATSMADLAALRAAVRAAGTVAIVGGGATGVELAGEIATDAPKTTKVHLFQRGGSILSEPKALPAAFRAKVAASLARLGVAVHTGAAVAAPSPLPAGVRSLFGGRVLLGATPLAVAAVAGAPTPAPLPLTADVVVFTTGGAPNSAALRSGGGPLAALLDAAGQVRVTPSLQVEGLANVFALGDITNIAEAKLAYNVSLHAPVVSKNVLILARALAAGPSAPAPAPGAYYKYAPSPHPTLFITTGRNAAFGIVNGWNLPNFVVRGAKAGDLMTGKFLGVFGFGKTAPPPPPPAAAAVVVAAGAAKAY